MVLKSNRMLQLLNHRLRIQTQDGKTMIGEMIAFDQHMNLVLADCVEYRQIKRKKSNTTNEDRRTLGLVILRGETIVSVIVESGPPPTYDSQNKKERVPASIALSGASKTIPRPPPSMLMGQSVRMAQPVTFSQNNPMMMNPMVPPPPIPTMNRGVPPFPPGMIPPPGYPPMMMPMVPPPPPPANIPTFAPPYPNIYNPNPNPNNNQQQ